MIRNARFLVLEAYSSSREGRLVPVSLAAVRTMRCSRCLSLEVAAANHTVMEEVSMVTHLKAE